MKICLYLEYHHFCKGVIFNKMGTGIRSAYRNQRAILQKLNISFTEKWDDSCDILQINMLPLPIKTVYLIKMAKRKGKEVIIWSHTTVEDTKQVFKFLPFLTPLFKKYLTYIYRSADLIFSPTEYTKSLLIAYGLPADKILVLSNGVDIAKHYPDEAKKLSGKSRYGLEKITVGTVGLAMPRKGIDTFLNLARHNPEYKFIWFGKIFSPYSSILVRPLPKDLPANVNFSGYVDDVNEAYNCLDIFLFPSFEENEGMSILEAAAMKLPILVRDIPVYQGWLIHGKNCLKAKNDLEFERYLRELINDKKLCKTLGSNAFAMVKSKSIKVLAQKTLSEYERLLRN